MSSVQTEGRAAHRVLYRIGAVLLAMGTLGHTIGGMLITGQRGPGAGPEADGVMARMRAVHFAWRGADSTWFDWWMGNGLGVSSLLLLAIAVLWSLGARDRRPPVAIAWAAFVSIGLLSVCGYRYFGGRIGSVFGLIALLTGIATALSRKAEATQAVAATPNP